MERENNGTFAKGNKGYWTGKKRPNLWNGTREDLKGKHISPNTEIKEGQHLGKETEFKNINLKGYKRPYVYRKAKKIYFEKTGIYRIPEGCCIHHIDQNPLNNNPENLQLMDKGFHRQLHIEFNKQEEPLVC